MLDHKAVSANLDETLRALERRGFAFPRPAFEDLSAKRRTIITHSEELRAKLNELSKKFGAAIGKHGKDSPEVAAFRSEIETLKQNLAQEETDRARIEAEFEQLMLGIPNLPSERTPNGLSADDNQVLSEHNPKPIYSFAPKDHVELGERLGIFEFDRAVKLSGARFTVVRGPGARLERAIANFLVDTARRNGYEEVSVPLMVKRDIMTGTGQLPKFEEDLFRLQYGEREWFLIPTAEVPVTNLFAQEIIDPGELPQRFCAYTACFRAEAGSHGRDTKGIIRQHQFHKVELVHFCRAEEWEAEFERLVASAQSCLDTLGLHYRKINLAAGDLGFSARLCYDLEVWLPGQNAYREISSCSHFGDFQARRAQIRTRGAGNKTVLVHTLNGSALPIGRTLVAILEQGQQADGSVVLPEALRPYAGFSRLEPGRIAT